tara:strand:+ start:2121 stop:2681 length:561 start_codon:yes stop_codon:yes gene_type:complete
MDEQSFITFQQFPDKDLLERCGHEIKDLVNEYPEIIISGTAYQQSSCVCFFSNESESYYYYNKQSPSKPMTRTLSELLIIVNKIYDSHFNGILINKYKNGNDYICANSYNDKNCDLSNVVTISYGATRKFRIRKKDDKKFKTDFKLITNSMLQMGGNFQQEFTHEIPIEKRVKTERISFTFRKHTK